MSISEFEKARELLNDPSLERVAAALMDARDEGRRHGERWAEIAIANFLRQGAPIEEQAAMEAILARAAEIETRAWRVPEMKSSLDLEAEARAAGVHMTSGRPEEGGNE